MKTSYQICVAACTVAAVFCCLFFADWRKAAGANSRGQDAAELAGTKEGSHPAKGDANRFEAEVKTHEERPGELIPEPLPEEQIATLLSKRHDLSDPAVRTEFVAELKRLEDLQIAQTEAKALELGLPLLTEHGSLLVGFDGDAPIYELSHNAGVAKSIGSDLVMGLPPYFPTGAGKKIGAWDVYWGTTENHIAMPGAGIGDNCVPGGLHASHVVGTLIASGYNNAATRGVVPQARVWSYSSSNVLSEIAWNATWKAIGNGGFSVSVHPYGVASGWEFDGAEWHGNFSNDGNPNNDVPSSLGQYSSTTSAWDGTAANNPYHLMVKSAGNHGDDNAPAAGGVWSYNGGTVFTYDPARHPKSDADHYTPSGYGTIDARASAKNVLTVGSASDAVTGAVRDPGAAVLSAFSSTGPTDDGRIKPDLVGNGEDVLSVDGSTIDGYIAASGTSMACAGVAGSAQLLHDIHNAITGQNMWASSLKGLLIHTADDLETPGPDYRTGWGLVNCKAAADLLHEHGATSAELLRQGELSTSQSLNYFVVDVAGDAPIRITLCWTDLAGAWTNGHDNRSPRLVNDLNLRLVSLDGNTTYFPYVMPFTNSWDPNDFAAPAQTGVNTVDNVEQIYVEAPVAGTYRIEVDYAGTLQDGSQEYSLIVSETEFFGSGVAVSNPVSDQAFMVIDTSPINGVANANDVFSGSGHQYDISWSPEGVLTAEVDASGSVNLFPTAIGYGEVNLTLTATDSNNGTASTTFSITLLSSILRVDANTLAPAGSQHGGTWANAIGRLQDALAMALPGQEIWVANGVYYPDEHDGLDTGDRNDAFVLPSGVRLFGGFAGSESVRSERNLESLDTILSGDINQDDSQQPVSSYLQIITGADNNSQHVMRIAPGAISILIDGFVVTGGQCNDFFEPDGAGLLIGAAADATIRNCLFMGNYANGEGGAIANDGGFLAIVNSRFAGNRSGIAGGALSLKWGVADISHCEFRGNESNDGGAVYISCETVSMTDCVFSGNTGSFGGGAIHLADGTFRLANCTLTGNFTNGEGAAIHVSGASIAPQVSNTIIWNNMVGGSATDPSASAWGLASYNRPNFDHSLVANSGGSDSWNVSLGTNYGGNIDGDPLFAQGTDPSAGPTAAGDFSLTVRSPAINGGLNAMMSADTFDLDGDGDIGEPVPFDLAGGTRVVSASVDLGACEFDELNLIDGDGDGMSDEFEAAHGGDLDPNSDDDGDGLTAVAEFVHGLDPNAPLNEPVADLAPMDYLGTQYFCMTYLVNPDAFHFVNITVERRGDLASPLGWQEAQTVVMSAVPSSSSPGLLEVTVRSVVPFGQDRMEFLRIRHDVIPTGGGSIPQGDPSGMTEVSDWNVSGQ